METEELIKKVLSVECKPREIRELFAVALVERGENYFKSEYWQKHREAVKKEMAIQYDIIDREINGVGDYLANMARIKYKNLKMLLL